MAKKGYFLTYLVNFMGPMKGAGDYWYVHNHGIILVYFFPTKTMEMIFFKSISSIKCENTTPIESEFPFLSTEFARNFCDGIGPLQLALCLL